MTDREFRNLQTGDIVASKFSKVTYVVTENFGCRVTAVRTTDITNAEEFELVLKAKMEKVL